MPRHSLEELARHPELLSTQVDLDAGEPLTLRLLRPEDGEMLAAYFLGLSAATRQLYAPHPFDAPTAARLCAEIDTTQQLRFVAMRAAPPSIIAYIIVRVRPGSDEVRRYATLGIPLAAASTCYLAPSVADAYQSRGIGSALMAPIRGWMVALGFRQMVLHGGTRAFNHRAIRFYTKLGFRRVGDFLTKGDVVNHDMILDLDP